MPTAILLGVPRGYIGAIQAELTRHPERAAGWKLKFVQSRNKWPSFYESEISQAMELARRAGGGHIFGYSTQNERQDLARKIRPFFRFRWADPSSLKKIGASTGEFLEELHIELAEEDEWIESVKPRELRSPILLPQCSFICEGAGDLWRHVEGFGPGNVQAAKAALIRFENLHWSKVVPQERAPAKYLWVDAKDRCFDHTQDRHGRAEFPRNWKYSFAIADGFHYDVRHVHGRSFQIGDTVGQIHRVDRNAYINIDPHGSVRVG